jgi:hypothetical protein
MRVGWRQLETEEIGTGRRAERDVSPGAEVGLDVGGARRRVEPEADRGLGERQLARQESDGHSRIGGERRGGGATKWIGGKVLPIAPTYHL